MKIVWLTGHSGSGKTTIAKKLQEDWPCIILDGDELRASISKGIGFSKPERTEHNFKVARLARELSKQTNVVVSVIAPIKEVRDCIKNVQWIYLKRTLPEREGHFYEVSREYPMLDCDNWTVDECVGQLKEILGIPEKKTYSLFIGRWQPLHKGHLALFDKIRAEGKNIAIGIRDTNIADNNPFSAKSRLRDIQRKVPDAKVFIMPDISEIVVGRRVGYDFREIHLDKETESISATKIREKNGLASRNI